MEDFLEVAIKAARVSGVLVKKYFLDGDYQVKTKSDNSCQTTADVESEYQLLDCLTKAFPDHGLVSEEQGLVKVSNSKYTWSIDPLDGTANFVLGIPYFSISLCLCVDNSPVLGVVFNPLTEQLFTASRNDGSKLNGERIRPSTTNKLSKAKIFVMPNERTQRELPTRRLIGSLYQQSERLLDTWAPALDWCLVACGKADGVFVMGDTPVMADVGMLAGMFILREAKGVISDFQNRPLTLDSRSVIGSNTSLLHRSFLDLLTEDFTSEPGTADAT